MNLNRWIIVPVSAAVWFAIGYGISALVGMFWHTMPPIVRWAIPSILMICYLVEAMIHEKPAK